MRETTDYVDKEKTLTPVLFLTRLLFWKTSKAASGRFFLEMDMGTERIVSQITRDKRISLFHKLSQYDRYLQSLHYRHTYAAFGDFRFFTLFITLGDERVENIRRQMQTLPSGLSEYYRLTTYEQAMGDFFSPIWKSRMLTDTELTDW